MRGLISKGLSFVLCLSLTIPPAHAGVELDCTDSLVEGMESCQIIDAGDPRQECSVNQPQDQLRALEDVVQEYSKVQDCKEEDLGFSAGKSKEEIAQFKKELKKECRKKAKEYKRAVLKDLMGRFKFGQALKVLFKRKKYSVKSTVGEENEATLRFDGKDLQGKSNEELNKMVMDELEKQFPGLKEKAEAMMKDHPSFKYGFHENESVPLNMVVKPNDSKVCSVKLQDLPKRDKFVPAECKFCEVKDVKNSFVNDCSYMVSKDMPESKVDALLGISNRNRKQYCQPNMTGRETDMSNIDSAATELCKIAQSGMVPDFDIQTSRNLYPDKTPELAKKRGQFIQKYLRDKLTNECDLATVPEWISNEEEFGQKVKLSHPFYEGGKKGDYGPDPMAPVSAQEQEVKNLRTTLLKEKADLQKQVSDLDQEIRAVETELTKANDEITKTTKNYTTLQKSVSKKRDLNSAGIVFDSEDPNSATSLINRLDEWVNLSNEHQQRLSDLNALKRGHENRLNNYSPAKIEEKVNLLQQFYTEKNTGKTSPGFYTNWDEKLFNDFKMVRISGHAKRGETLLAGSTSIEPKLDVMLNMLTKTDEFTCMVAPMQTKNVKVSAFLKGGAQIATGTVAVAGIIGAGALTLGVGVINSFLSLVCFGCGDPGSTLPTWRKIGNIFAMGGKSARKAFWREFKAVVSDFITINGRLSIKTNKDVRVNKYNDFEKYARQYYGDDYASKTPIEGGLTVKEIKDKKGKLIGVETYDSKGVLRELIEYSPLSGRVIKRERFNKDGVELE